MSEDALDRRLHDFLDGRLSDEERADFEARLRDDPDLAQRLAGYREIGDALRDDEALPPGFHARARARFEGRESAGRVWFRPISWESMGLAVAAMLVLAIFVPQWLDGDSPFETRVADVEAATEVDAVAPQKKVEAGRDAPARERLEADDSMADVRAQPQAEPEPPATFAPEVRRAKLAPKDAEEAEGKRQDADDAGAAVLQDAAATPGESHEFGAADTPENFAQAQEEPSEPSGKAGVVVEEEHQVAAAPGTTREAELAEVLELASKSEPFSARTIDRPVIGLGEVLVVDDLEALRRKNAQDAYSIDKDAVTQQSVADEQGEKSKEDKRAKRKKSTRVRWVVIGPRERPFACAGFKISSDDNAWIIGLSAPTAEQPAAPHGCVLTLPPDGKDVRVTGP